MAPGSVQGAHLLGEGLQVVVQRASGYRVVAPVIVEQERMDLPGSRAFLFAHESRREEFRRYRSRPVLSPDTS